MNFLRTGHFFGEINKTVRLNGMTLTNTDSDYTESHVDWHYHENPYFTLILQGRIIESNKRKSHHCSAGSLLFHGRQEPHYNVKPDGNTRCFHIEFDKNCFAESAFDIDALQGIFCIENPDIKFLLYKVFRETRIYDDMTAVSIQMLLLEIFGQMLRFRQAEQNKRPLWAERLKEILHDGYAEKLTLENLSAELNIHPVHLSKNFSRYFHCTFGEYVRKVRVEKSLSLMSDKSLSLTEIAFQCGFA